jgi:protein-disulfide isomerase
MKRYLPFIIIGGVLVALLGVGALMFNSNQSTTPVAELPKPTPAPTNAPGPDVPKPSVAVPKAFVTVDEFGDYQCPPCGGLHPVLKKLKAEFGDQLKLNFYHLPLTNIHKNALNAAHAAVAAKQQGKFWEMHNRLYETQNVWNEMEDIHAITAAFAQELKLDVAMFKRDMDSRTVAALVEADTKRAAGMKIDSTPTLLVEGQIFPNEKLSPENLREVILRFLGKAAN